MASPLVTIAIVSYNHERFIGRAIESVLSQDLRDLELYVLDDASTDNTAEVVNRFSHDPRLRFVRNPINLGAKRNSNQAFRTGSGRYFVWLSSDDFLLPGHLSQLVGALEAHPECDLAYTACYWVDEDDRLVRLLQHPGHPPFSYHGGRNEVAELLVHDCYITPSAAVIRREALDAAGELDPEPVTAGDWDLWLRIATRNSNFIFLDRPSTAYRVHPDQESAALYRSSWPLLSHLRVLERAMDRSLPPDLGAYASPIVGLLRAKFLADSEKLDDAARETIERRVDQIARRVEELGQSGAHETASPIPVTIFLPTADEHRLLQETLAWLGAEAHANWEAVTASASGPSAEALVRHLDSLGRTRYLHLTAPATPEQVFDTGVRFARGDWILDWRRGVPDGAALELTDPVASGTAQRRISLLKKQVSIGLWRWPIRSPA